MGMVLDLYQLHVSDGITHAGTKRIILKDRRKMDKAGKMKASANGAAHVRDRKQTCPQTR